MKEAGDCLALLSFNSFADWGNRSAKFWKYRAATDWLISPPRLENGLQR